MGIKGLPSHCGSVVVFVLSFVVFDFFVYFTLFCGGSFQGWVECFRGAPIAVWVLFLEGFLGVQRWW